MSKTLKEVLSQNVELIIEILEQYDFGNIRLGHNEIRASLPDGNNNTSVQIRLNDYLQTNIYTRSEFADEYQFNDFISLIQWVTGKRFQETYEYLCGVAGITPEYEPSEAPSLLKIFKQYCHKNCVTEVTIPREMIDKYPSHIVKEWIDEGIPECVQKIFDIRIDEQRHRWLVPSYNEDGNLVTVQGRTYLDNYKELGIPKYIYYKFGEGSIYNSNLFGLNITKLEIEEQKEVIIFEGAKSVMKAYSWGYKNTVAMQGANITELQMKKILALKANVVIAFDKDEKLKDINKILKELNQFTNVYYILDTEFLGDKDSPVDKGKEVFEKLLQEKKRYG